MTPVAQLLAEARRLGVERLDAQRLVAHRLGVPRAWVLAHDEAVLDAAQAAACRDDLRRRADGVPLAYLVGQREFRSLPLVVTPAVLDPRPDTETLVDWAFELLAGPLARATSAVDLGTGSGAIALALKHAHPQLQVHATDDDPHALAVAAGNAHRLGIGLEFAHGSWWDALPARRFDLALSNPPYIADDDPHLAALRHEPRHALTPGGDGMAAIAAIVAGAPEHLEPGGWLLLEHGFEQAEPVRALLVERGFADVATRHDLAGRPRCSGGRWPADAPAQRSRACTPEHGDVSTVTAPHAAQRPA